MAKNMPPPKPKRDPLVIDPDNEVSLSDVSDIEETPKPQPKIKPKKKTPRKPVKEESDEYSDLINDEPEEPAPIEPQEEESVTSSDHDADLVFSSDNEVQIEPEPNQETQNKEEESSTDEGTEIIETFTLPFVPGSSPVFLNNRRYLCLTTIGAVLLRGEEGSTSIDIHFYDQVKNREIHFENVDDFQHAAMDENGVLFASRTTVSYRHFSTWSTESTITMTSEFEVSLVAVGNGWFAFGGSNQVRVFTSAGYNLANLQVSDTLVSMAGRDKYLFIVYGPYSLTGQFFNVNSMEKKWEGVLSSGHPLKWIGIDDLGRPALLNDSFILNVLYKDFDYQWIPFGNFSPNADADETDFWVVEADSTHVYGIVLRGTKTPQTHELPHFKMHEIHPLTIDDKYIPLVMRHLMYQYDHSVPLSDAEYLKLFRKFIQDGDAGKAVQCAQHLKLDQSRALAVRYADKHGHRHVSDRLIGINEMKKSTLGQPLFKAKNDKEIEEMIQNFRKKAPENKAKYVRKEDEKEEVKEGSVEKPENPFFEMITKIGKSTPVKKVSQPTNKKLKKTPVKKARRIKGDNTIVSLKEFGFEK